MAIEQVKIGVSEIKNLLDSGYTWLKKDDLGYGSIQETFGASDIQIATIRKHPILKTLETSAKVFVIVDDITDNTSVDLPAVKKEPAETPTVEQPALSTTEADAFMGL